MVERRKRGCGTVIVLSAVLGAGALYLLRRRVDRETLQRRFWRPVYDRLAPLYDLLVDPLTGFTTHRYRQRALPYLPPEGARVLEIGVGTGRFHVELAERYRLAGIDLAAGMVRLTQERLARRGLHSDLRQADVRALPWPDASFDAVVGTFVLSAVPDADAALDELVRVLQPGGRLVLVDAGESADGHWFAWLLARLWETFGDYMRDEVPLLRARGLVVARKEFGPGGCVHVVAGTKR
ncbi:MAG: class I SAM-dependent methyltransferase [Anaerolineae bacterium]